MVDTFASGLAEEIGIKLLPTTVFNLLFSYTILLPLSVFAGYPKSGIGKGFGSSEKGGNIIQSQVQ